jgi:cytochrome b
MKKILIWDIPARLIHWAFAVSLTAALAIGFLGDDDSSFFQFHMLFGITAMFLLVLRIVLGFVGSRYSRFASYPVRPRGVITYLLSAVTSKSRLYAGNNPGSATVAVFMFLVVPCLILTGLNMNDGDLKEIHELFALSLLALIVIHLAGLALHTFKHRENIALSMVTGKKDGKTEDAIASAHPVWGAILLIVAGLWIGTLFSNHNAAAATVNVPVLGATVHLGEHESEGGHDYRDDDDDDHDDDD